MSAETLHAKGDPRNPLSWDEVVDKHRGIVAGLVDDAVDDEIISLVANVDHLPDMGPLTDVLGRLRLG